MPKIKHRTIQIITTVGMLLFYNSGVSQVIYGYSVGVSLINTVVPGSVVAIPGVLKNTGNQPIRFAPSLTYGPPSVQGGSLPTFGMAYFGGWNILDSNFRFGVSSDYFAEFAAVNINPGDSFYFTIGTFTAPTDRPLGSAGFIGYELNLNISDDIRGGLRGPSGLTYDYSWYNNIPILGFTMGTSSSRSDYTFYDAIVVDISTGAIFPRLPITAAPVPESSTLLPISCVVGFATMLSAWRRRQRNSISPQFCAKV